MIQLVVSDIDGTLLQDGANAIPPAIFEQIARLRGRGIRFCPASGRQYTSLRKLFAPVADRMAFLIENGGGIYYQDKLIYAHAFDRATAIQIAQYVQALPGCEFLADGEGDSYAIPKSAAFVRQLEEVQKLQVRYIQDFGQFPERVMKIAVWCPGGTAGREAAFARDWGDCSRIAVSGAAWIDFSCSDKGAGLQAACGLFGIPQERTIAFGDNWNDESMLDYVACPYIMSTAPAALREKYPCICRNVPDQMKKIWDGA